MSAPSLPLLGRGSGGGGRTLGLVPTSQNFSCVSLQNTDYTKGCTGNCLGVGGCRGSDLLCIATRILLSNFVYLE